MADVEVGDIVEVFGSDGWEEATVDRIEVRTWQPGNPRWAYVRLRRTHPFKLPSGRIVDTDIWTTPLRSDLIRHLPSV